MENNTHTPLVSIIVRTKDRPRLLEHALESIATQTYRPIGVVLVNDGGCDLNIERLNSILGSVSLNYIRLERNTGRAHAGNVGIEHANGDYIGFLDDDDELYPEHIAVLATFLRQDDFLVAYTAVGFVEKVFNADKSSFEITNKHIFAREFSYEDLVVANYIPLIALLFKSHFLRTIKFDESFDLYEDWDMLIRAGKVTQFHFINKVTAIYNQWNNSQIAFKGHPEMIRRATLQLYTKHWQNFPIESVFHMRQAIAEKDVLIAEKDSYIEKKKAYLNDLEKIIAEKQAYISALHSGRGWRLLSRYYRIRDRFLSAISGRRKSQ